MKAQFAVLALFSILGATEFFVIHVMSIYLIVAFLGDVSWPSPVTIGGILAALSASKSHVAVALLLCVTLLIYRRSQLASKRLENLVTGMTLLIRYFDISMSDNLRDRPAPALHLRAAIDFLTTVFCWHGDMPMQPSRGDDQNFATNYRCLNVAARLTDDLRRVLRPTCPLVGQYVDSNGVADGPYNKFIADVCPEQPLAEQGIYIVLLAVRSADIAEFKELRITLVRRAAWAGFWEEVDDKSKHPEAELILWTWSLELKNRL